MNPLIALSASELLRMAKISFSDRDTDRDAINIPDDEDHEPGRSIIGRRDEVKLPEDEYRTGEVNDVMVLSPTKRTFPTYQIGCLVSSSFFISGSGFLIDHDYFAPTIEKEYDAICRSAGCYPTSDQAEPADILVGQILYRYFPSRIPPRIAICSPQAVSAVVKEIDDLLRTRAGPPPETAHANLYDPRYIKPPLAFPTLIVKRKPLAYITPGYAPVEISYIWPTWRPSVLRWAVGYALVS